MKVSVEIKIKTKGGEEILLDGDDAKELFIELKRLYGKETVYVPYAPVQYPVYPCYPLYPSYTYTTSSGIVSMTTTVGEK